MVLFLETGELISAGKTYHTLGVRSSVRKITVAKGTQKNGILDYPV